MIIRETWRPGAFVVAAFLSLAGVTLQAGTTLPIPNGSFESPPTVFVDTRIDSWQKTPKPDWYDESGGFTWDQLSGVFLNTAPTNATHIDNLDGSQALYLFAVPQVGISQDYYTIAGTNSEPSRAFTARFEAGKAYQLSFGVVGGGGGMTNGASLLVSLTYRDGASNQVAVASTNIVFTPETFPTFTHLIDYQVQVPAVQPGDPWAGQYIGVQVLSTVDPALAGGYWDLDHFRLTETLFVPNGSFEAPPTEFVDTRIDAWQKTPKPDWYDESGGFTWDQLSGVFLNTAPTNATHIDNIHGQQALYLFAVPQVGIFQDYSSVSGTNSTPSREFSARFEPGKSYQLTVGVVSGGGGMTNGASLLMGLYYRDAANNIVPVAGTNIVFTPEAFPNVTHLIDYQVRTLAVQAGDPWAGQFIGVHFLSTVDPALAGGYWDLDNVRLDSFAGTSLSLRAALEGSELILSWDSAAGTLYQLQGSQDLRSWSTVGPALPGTGGVLQQRVPAGQLPHQFFRLSVQP